jgi:pterin-4a-carbinolamine dehydratase
MDDPRTPVRRASSRLANTVKHHPDNTEAIRAARVALVRAQAKALRDEADRLEAGA